LSDLPLVCPECLKPLPSCVCDRDSDNPDPPDPFCSSCRLLREDCSCFPDDDICPECDSPLSECGHGNPDEYDDFEDEDPLDIDHLGLRVEPDDDDFDEDEPL